MIEQAQQVVDPGDSGLPDPDDDMILELAFAAGCRYVVTHNVRDFAGCERLGIEAVTPREFLRIIRPRPTP